MMFLMMVAMMGLTVGTVATVLFREVRLPYIAFLSGEREARMATGEIRMTAEHFADRKEHMKLPPPEKVDAAMA